MQMKFRTKSPKTKPATRRPSTASELAEEEARFGIHPDSIGQEEARKIMSEQHKTLGFRPPPDSLAAFAQLVATNHPIVVAPVALEVLRSAVKLDSERILLQRRSEKTAPVASTSNLEQNSIAPVPMVVDINTMNNADVRLLMSFTHRALGYRPPPGSLAANAQASVQQRSQKNLSGKQSPTLPESVLKEAASRDADRIRSTVAAGGLSQPGASTDSQENTTKKKKVKRLPKRRPRIAAKSSDPTSNSSQSVSGSDTQSPPSSEPSTSSLSTSTAPPPALHRAETTDSVEIIGDVLIVNSI
ncbi:hypothetical protein BXZ70DRAFT_1007681 [Cristinia sonorae]|uniref:Uncharacterized protein n=1 Tax=Cristinia sonorae TaxID=1940300 RepID=A0A8K0UP54_9AGAR|nr:hypothetical protein BXZ70DRAFT_1007681 [Cristinia sonorae]